MRDAGDRESVVRVADWAAGQGEHVLVTLGLGSCVAIMLYDGTARAGAMAHVLLPSRSLARDSSNPAKFPETAVPLLIEQLRQLNADPRRLVAKLVGEPACSPSSRRRARSKWASGMWRPRVALSAVRRFR